MGAGSSKLPPRASRRWRAASLIASFTGGATAAPFSAVDGSEHAVSLQSHVAVSARCCVCQDALVVRLQHASSHGALSSPSNTSCDGPQEPSCSILSVPSHVTKGTLRRPVPAEGATVEDSTRGPVHSHNTVHAVDLRPQITVLGKHHIHRGRVHIGLTSNEVAMPDHQGQITKAEA